MKLYILRHGHASPTGVSDDSRELTDQGRSECDILGQWMKKQSISVDEIWSSPFTRANHTAEIIKTHIGSDVTIHHHSRLIPSTHPEELLKDLQNFNKNSLLIVSHMPLVGRFTHALMSGHEDEPIFFETCGLASLEVAELRYQAAYLEWLVNPGILAY